MAQQLVRPSQLNPEQVQTIAQGIRQIESQALQHRNENVRTSIRGLSQRLIRNGRIELSGATDTDVQFLNDYLQKILQKDAIEHYRWLEYLVSVLLETRYRAETVLSKPVPLPKNHKESGVMQVEMTMNELGPDKNAGVEFLREKVRPFIDRNRERPDFFQRLVNGLNVYANSEPTLVGSLFINLSAQGRILVPPYLDVIAMALLDPTVRKKIETWAHNYWKEKYPNAMVREMQLKQRFLYLEDSLKAADAEKEVENTTEQFLVNFEQAYAQRDQAGYSQCNLQLQSFFRDPTKGHEVIALLAKTLSSRRTLDETHQHLAELVVEYYYLVVESSTPQTILLHDMCVSVGLLDDRIQRLNDKKSLTRKERALKKLQEKPTIEPVEKVAARFLTTFEQVCARRDSNGFSEADHKLREYFRHPERGHRIITSLASTLSSKPKFNEVHQKLIELLVKNYYLAVGDSIVETALLHDTIDHLDQRLRGPTEPIVDKAPAQMHLQDLMKATKVTKSPDDQKSEFIMMLEEAIYKQGPSLGINPEKSSFRVIGAGGTCVVVELYDEVYDEPIAVRCDVMGLTDAVDGALFIRSVAIHSKLKHPNIVEDRGFADLSIQVTPPQGAPASITMVFQKMELLKGAQGLDRIVDTYQSQGKVPSAKAMKDFLFQYFSTLDYIHGSNITHRDIKLENLMILPPVDWDGEDMDDLLMRGHLKFLDLGLARDNSATADSPYTFIEKNGEPMIPGTLRCLAPETFVYPEKTREPSGDVWASCVDVLYRLMTGQNKFHPTKYSRRESIDFGNIIEVSYKMGGMSEEEPSVIDVKDPALRKFLTQSKHDNSLAEGIVKMASAGGEIDPEKRPKASDFLTFLEPYHRENQQDSKGSQAPKRRSSRLAKATGQEEPSSDGFWNKLKRAFGRS